MYNITAYIDDPVRGHAKIRQLSPKREWMNSGHYNCYPLNVANSVGYGVYFDEDISFIWDGVAENPPKGILGSKYIWEGRSNGAASLATGLVFKSDPDVSLMTMPIPNYFRKEFNVVSTVLSTSFFTGELSIALQIQEDYINKEIVLPANTDIACIIPISISQFNESTINIANQRYPFDRIHDRKEYVDALHKHFRETGKRLRLYKNGKDEKNNKIGDHELSSLKMNVKEV
jgi:hypothetical protein